MSRVSPIFGLAAPVVRRVRPRRVGGGGAEDGWSAPEF
jgi:hypothetical protein